MGSELIFRGHEAHLGQSDSYSPKPEKPWVATVRPIQYLLREQRLVYILIGIAIATVFFTIAGPSSSPTQIGGTQIGAEYFPRSEPVAVQRSGLYEHQRVRVVEPLLLEVDQIYHLACPAPLPSFDEPERE